uniref:Cytochrome c oxidase subunit 3 n=1 Tax=Plectrocnemia tsukuiensis TaxID=623670 RepID=A0A9E8RSJ2_9NEOP|nr:cytochrome c oxidase subunit III [Plectrocnemia tsukuiensis]UZZ43693.1 cytochrome c oxidase subunit III [Plectrocnemia tsukuiensis]
MKFNNNHPFHLVNYSPWPIIGSWGTMIFMMGLIKMFNKMNTNLMNLGLLIIILTMIQWWRDITRESTNQGFHTKKVMMNMKWGMIMFIISEILFFTSFFWAFFHSTLSPIIDLGMLWPPKNIQPFNPFKIPLLNSIILLSSGITVTWTHQMILMNNKKKSMLSLMFTIMLGVYFTMIQIMEYKEAPFSLNDSIYGTTFFVTTGFHGLHVLIGTTMLIISMMRLKMNHFSMNHHIGLEVTIWYWHFVDVVWLFLFIFMYWWSK